MSLLFIYFRVGFSFLGRLGNVHFLSEADAVAANLTYVDSEGHVIIKVDNSTNAAGDESYGRNSVYLESTTTMTYGSLLGEPSIDQHHSDCTKGFY